MRRLLSTPFFLLLPLFALGAASPSKLANRFEGIIDLKLTMEAGGGDLSLSLAGDMAKLDMQLKVAPLPEPIQLAVILDSKTPKTATLLSEGAKTYRSIKLSDAGKSTNPTDKDSVTGKYKVKIHGEEKLLGYACTHVTLTRGGELIDAWITKEMPEVYLVLKKLQEANPQMGEPALFRALDATGHAGLPMRFLVIRDGQRVSMEVKKVERRTLAPALFIIPNDYVRNEGQAAGIPGSMGSQ